MLFFVFFVLPGGAGTFRFVVRTGFHHEEHEEHEARRRRAGADYGVRCPRTALDSNRSRCIGAALQSGAGAPRRVERGEWRVGRGE